MMLLISRVETFLFAGIALCSFVTAQTEALPKGVLALPLTRIVNQTAYGVALKVGTPPQPMTVLVDTGSSYIGLQGTKSNWCKLPDKPCELYGSYNNLTSSTAIYKNATFFNTLINHGFGSYISDTIRVGDVTATKLIFGMITDYEATYPAPNPNSGLMGLVPNCINSNCTANYRTTLLEKLLYHGHLTSNTMSIYLGPDEPKATGSLIYGGIDKAKQQGKAVTLPVLDPTSEQADGTPNYLTYSSIAIQTKSDGVSKTQEPEAANSKNHKVLKFDIPQNSIALLDTGNPGFELPRKVYSYIKQYMNLTRHTNEYTGAHKVDCKFRKQQSDDATLLVGFGNDQITIKIPFNRLVTELAPGKCVTLIGGAGNGKFLACGDPCLRSMYTVWDFDNLTITMSNVNYTTATNIVPA